MQFSSSLESVLNFHSRIYDLIHIGGLCNNKGWNSDHSGTTMKAGICFGGTTMKVAF